MDRRPVMNDLGFLLTRAGVAMVRDANVALASLDLKVRPYTVLELACEAHEGVAQRSVAADMGLDPSQIVGLIDDLESRGLVARTPDPRDRRNKLVSATSEGLRVCGHARALVNEVSARRFADTDPHLLAAIRKVLIGIAFS